MSKENNINKLSIFQECIHIIIKIINIILINHKSNIEEISNTKFFDIFSLFLQNFKLNSQDKTKFNGLILPKIETNVNVVKTERTEYETRRTERTEMSLKRVFLKTRAAKMPVRIPST